MTIKRPTRQTFPRRAPWIARAQRRVLTSSAAQRRVRQAPARRAAPVVPTPKQRGYAFRAPK